MSKQKKKVAILVCLSSLDGKYSVAGVVHDQLNMLSEAGEEVVFITASDFHDQDLVPKGIEIRYYERYHGSLDDIDVIAFEKYVFDTAAVLRVHLKDCTTCIQHDLLFIKGFLPVGWSLRRAAEDLPKLKWLHWMHSGPSKRQELEYPYNGGYESMPNSEFIYLNHTDVPKVAAMYDIPENNVRVVHNLIDPAKYYKFHDLTKEIVKNCDLYSADTICVYPTRMTSAKQPNKLIKLIEKFKARGHNIKLIICNSWSNAEKEKEYLDTLKSNTTLSSSELIFTSELKSRWCKDNGVDIELGVPKEVVGDLLKIADLFVLPSISEACSMIMLEAAMSKNLMVLNEDLWSLHEWGGQKMDGQTSQRALYMSFGSVTRQINSYYPSEDKWFEDQAALIESTQNHNQAINFFKHVRKRHNPKWVYENQLRPLL